MLNLKSNKFFEFLNWIGLYVNPLLSVRTYNERHKLPGVEWSCRE